MDRFDRDVMYFLLFGKQISHLNAMIREVLSSTRLYHIKSIDELILSQERCSILIANITMIDKSSELFFSQLKPSDLYLYAERFWDTIISNVIKNDTNIVSIDVNNNNNKNSPLKSRNDENYMTLDIYREIILIGMLKYIEQTNQSYQLSSHLNDNNYKSTNNNLITKDFIMRNYEDLMRLKTK